VFSAYAPPAPKKKQVQQKERFIHSGGRLAAATKAPASATATPAATVAAVSSKKSSKPRKIKREKIRFGQAPRLALPPGPQETATGGDVGAGASSASEIPGGSTAPGAAMTSIGDEENAQNSDVNPLTPVEPKAKKTRFAERENIVIAEKKAAKERKIKEKAAATPEPISAEEKATQQAQAAPMGLNGDTAKKKKKVKVKGAPKERLQDRPSTPEAPAPAPAPTVNPALGQGPLGPTAPPPPTAPAPATPPSN
jgi:peptidyl-prolyl cis-trans isomerase SurA